MCRDLRSRHRPAPKGAHRFTRARHGARARSRAAFVVAMVRQLHSRRTDTRTGPHPKRQDAVEWERPRSGRGMDSAADLPRRRAARWVGGSPQHHPTCTPGECVGPFGLLRGSGPTVNRRDGSWSVKQRAAAEIELDPAQCCSAWTGRYLPLQRGVGYASTVGARPPRASSPTHARCPQNLTSDPARAWWLPGVVVSGPVDRRARPQSGIAERLQTRGEAAPTAHARRSQRRNQPEGGRGRAIAAGPSLHSRSQTR